MSVVRDVSDPRARIRALGVTTAILAFEILASAVWLRRFRYGPMEWLWRCATWGGRVPLRRAVARPAAGSPAGGDVPAPGTERGGVT